jgi:hypothetical protein
VQVLRSWKRPQHAPQRVLMSPGCQPEIEELSMLGTILIVILILALLGALPRWPHSRNWGYYPTGGLGVVLLIVIVLLLLGRI